MKDEGTLLILLTWANASVFAGFAAGLLSHPAWFIVPVFVPWIAALIGRQGEMK